ncbi:MAG: VWA domain-containing protein [Rhodospirillaceae bacterium]|jgi:Flp pilus assembly protein TadG|nr:VWA domain-containing protein [Rhodospirillaceae bacterium]MBT5244318.1 VWA domain-containing protein [Rhodospirillaceae bacterium]MBT5563679.1 VWA domain-containing protein [Rhodospirillaceae bacterium]MBT6241509.1 VWA domain-containing protein [Rhodospirillaceae bacterium]MBT7137075.1 VWA domain-containing protein [Rhodospirillaceae bacterium]
MNIPPVFNSIWQTATSFLHRLRKDHGGAVAIYLAFAIVPVIGFVGIGTDTARAYMVKSRLSSALDAAGLAGGKAFFSTTRDQDIEMFFNANFPTGYMDAVLSGPVVNIDTVNETITLSASATIPTTFMRLIGHETIVVSSDTEITRQIEMLDLVLAIDMSGSMSSSAGAQSRISAAREAALLLVDILFGNSGNKDLLKIGLVPWNAKVNVTIDGSIFNAGGTITQPVAAFTNPETGINQSEVYFANNSPVPLLAPPPANWKGCVYSRFIDDANPDSDADILMPPVSTIITDWPAWQPIGVEGEPVSGGTCTSAVGGSECRRCLSHGITPLQSSKASIESAISDLQNPTSTTNIPQGMGWAWRVLKPDSPFTEAEANPPMNRQQAIVLLTDGENYGGSGDGYKGTFGLGGTARLEMDARLQLISDNIKADGVIVYVIQFANNGSALQTLLQGVASGPGSPFYHYAPDAAALQQVFHEIASHLSELRLSK